MLVSENAIFGDAAPWEQAIRHLLSNAIQFTPKEDISEYASLLFTLTMFF